MDKEKLTARLASLIAERERVVANLNAYNGAIEDTKFWLSELDKEEQNGKITKVEASTPQRSSGESPAPDGGGAANPKRRRPTSVFGEHSASD